MSFIADRILRRPLFFARRRALLESARGDVLDLACGNGVNFALFPAAQVRAVTAIELSPARAARAKEAASRAPFPVEIVVGDVLVVDLAGKRFDTVVSTLALCTYADPVAAVRKMAGWCAPGGQILFLEHGISSSRLVRALQRFWNPVSRAVAGCTLDRDIESIIRGGGVEIVRAERTSGGAVYAAEAGVGG